MSRRWLAGASWLAIGCASCSEERVAPHDPRYAAATELTISCGGGIAGTYGGRTLHRDGRVEIWAESAGGDADGRRQECRIAPDRAALVFDALGKSGLLELPPGSASNWCCEIRLIGPSSRFSLFYEGDPPAAVRDVVLLVQSLCPELDEK